MVTDKKKNTIFPFPLLCEPIEKIKRGLYIDAIIRRSKKYYWYVVVTGKEFYEIIAYM